MTTGSGSYSTRTDCAASTTSYLSSPMTIATASPTCLTSPRASGQRSGVFISTPGGAHAIGSGASRSLMSSPVKTPLTPGRASASDASIETIFACASGERTTAMYSIPCRTKSSTYVARPVMRRGSSLRRIDWPTCLAVGASSMVLMPLTFPISSAAAWTALTMLW